MADDIFKRMQSAIDTKELSDHHTHKVGALIHTKSNHGSGTEIKKANFWPKILEEHFGQNRKLGNASTTVHAEVAAICATKSTEGATLYVTEFPCPNCAKMIAESKIEKVYIDSNAHKTPLGIKMKPYFDGISIKILKAANIFIYEIDIERKTFTTIIEASDKRLIQIHHPLIRQEVHANEVNAQGLDKHIKIHKEQLPFAACYAKSDLGQYYFLAATAHRSLGLTKKQATEIRNFQKKYEPSLQPLNRILLSCSRFGLTIDPNFLYSSQVPTCREFVNVIGAGLTKLTIEDHKTCRDKWGIEALQKLRLTSILN